MLRLRGVTLRPALEAVDLDLAAGEIAALVGGHAAGKTVLLKIICGLLRPDSGEVIFDDVDLSKASESELRPLRLKFGVAFQNLALYDRLTLLQNVAHPLLRRGLAQREADDRAASQLAAVGLAGSERKLPHELSGGMRRRAALARALVANPEVCLFDDPFTGLDPVASARIARLIDRAAQRTPAPAILIAAADPAPLQSLAQRFVHLVRGRKK